MNALGELFVGLGFDIDDSKLEGFAKTVDDTVNNIGKLALAAVAVVVAMDKIVESATRGTTALMNFNSQTGLSIDKLQSLQVAAQLQNIGLSADDVTASVQGLQSQLAQIRLGQGNIAPFQLMGIDVLGQDAFGVLDQVREKIKGLDDMTATNLISQMGINPQMITVLRMTRSEFGELNKEILLDKGQRAAIMKVGIEVKKLQMLFEAFINKTIAKLAPALIGIVKFMENLVYAVQKLNLAVPVMMIAMTGILKVFKLLNLQTLAWTAAIAGVLLLLDDFAVWSKGGQSLFDYSGMLKFFESLSDMVDKFVAGVEKLASLTSFTSPKFTADQLYKNPSLGSSNFSSAAPVPVFMFPSSKNNNVNQNNNITIHAGSANAKEVQNAQNAEMQASYLKLKKEMNK